MSVTVLRQGDGTAFQRIAPGGFQILAALVNAAKVIGHDLTITAGTDHHTDGKHVIGEAYDLRVRDFDVPTLVRLKQLLTATLGPRFTVLYECPLPPSDPALLAIAFINQDASAPHLHLQTKKGTVYPPAVEIEGVPV